MSRSLSSNHRCPHSPLYFIDVRFHHAISDSIVSISNCLWYVRKPLGYAAVYTVRESPIHSSRRGMSSSVASSYPWISKSRCCTLVVTSNVKIYYPLPSLDILRFTTCSVVHPLIFRNEKLSRLLKKGKTEKKNHQLRNSLFASNFPKVSCRY